MPRFAYDDIMTFIQKTTLSKLSLLAAGSLALLALTGCTPNNNVPDLPATPAPTTSSASAVASSHLDVSANFQPDSEWTIIRESDRTKKNDTVKVHNIRWNTGDDNLLTVTDIKALFDENGYTLDECFEQIGNCIGTAPIEGGSVDVSMTATKWSDAKTGELDRNELSFETSTK